MNENDDTEFDVGLPQDEDLDGGLDIKEEIARLKGEKKTKKKSDDEDGEILFTDEEELDDNAGGDDEDDDHDPSLDVKSEEEEEKEVEKVSDAVALRRELNELKRQRAEDALAALTEKEEAFKQNGAQLVATYNNTEAKLAKASTELTEQKALRRAAMEAGNFQAVAAHDEFIDKLSERIGAWNQSKSEMIAESHTIAKKLEEIDTRKKQLSAKPSPSLQKFLDEHPWFNGDRNTATDKNSKWVHQRAQELIAKGITGDHLFTVLRRNIKQRKIGAQKKGSSVSAARGVSSSVSGGGGSGVSRGAKVVVTPSMKRAMEAANIDLTDKSAVKTFVSTLLASKYRKGA